MRGCIAWSTTSALEPDPNSGQYEWAAQQFVPGAGTSHGPALANFKDDAYLAWKGAGGDTRVFLSRLGTNLAWTTPQQVPVVSGSVSSPALAAMADALYLAWVPGLGDQRIFWSKSADGETWSPGQPVPGSGTTDCPALVATPFGVFLAWKGEGADLRIFWSMWDGAVWSPQRQVLDAASTRGPAFAYDASGNLVLAWITSGGEILFSVLGNPRFSPVWDRPALRFGTFGTGARPALLGCVVGPQGVAELPLMLAWRGYNDQSINYGRLYSPRIEYIFGVDAFQILNMRSGSIFGKTESDTDYVSMGLQIVGQSPQVVTKNVGDQTGGNVPVGLGISCSLLDTDVVIFTYHIQNSSQGDSTVAFLVNAATALLSAAEKADYAAIKIYTGVDLAALPPALSGALIGAQIGTALVPVIGTALGALAGWLLSIAPWGALWPKCDGPVAAGIHIFNGAQLRARLGTRLAFLAMLNESDDNPGVASAHGCDSNSHYVVDWSLSPILGQ